MMISNRLLVVCLAVGSALTLVWQGTSASFSAQTDNTGNTFAAGTVNITDDDAGSALFTAAGLTPGSAGDRCIAVTYTGSSDVDVRLYAAVSETDGAADGAVLDDYLSFTVDYDDSTTGTFGGGCGDFSSEGQLFTGTLNALAAHSSYASGVPLGAAGSAWAPIGGGRRVFKFHYELAAAAPNTVQGDSATTTMTWEAQNT